MAKIDMPQSSLMQNNSNLARQEKKKATKHAPITKGKLRKRSLGMKFADVFFEGDLKSAIDYMIHDVAIPQAKNAVIKGIEVMFYGGVGGGGSRNASSSVPYNSYWVGRDGSRTTTSSSSRPTSGDGDPKIRKNYDPRLIVIEDRGLAERILIDLRDECNGEYGQVSVGTLFDLAGIETGNWALEDYGWKRGDLDRARVRGCQGGWCFDLPDPVVID